MLHHRQYTPPVVRSLLNHLDAALDASTALLGAQAAADPHNILRFELTVIAHVLQAREDMRELRVTDNALASQVALFLAVTADLEEAAPPNTAAVQPEAAATSLIGGRISVQTLMALATAMRDVVELCFASFDDKDEAKDYAPAAQVSEAMVWATAAE